MGFPWGFPLPCTPLMATDRPMQSGRSALYGVVCWRRSLDLAPVVCTFVRRRRDCWSCVDATIKTGARRPSRLGPASPTTVWKRRTDKRIEPHASSSVFIVRPTIRTSPTHVNVYVLAPLPGQLTVKINIRWRPTVGKGAAMHVSYVCRPQTTFSHPKFILTVRLIAVKRDIC